MRPCGIVKLPRLLTFLQEKSQSLQLQVQPLNAKLALHVASDDEALSQQEQHCKWSAPNSRNNGAWVYNQKARLLICDVTMHRLSERLRSLVSSCSSSSHRVAQSSSICALSSRKASAFCSKKAREHVPLRREIVALTSGVENCDLV